MKRIACLLVLAVLVIGCSTPQGKGAAMGGAAGSILGGVIGHQSGHGVGGAAIGAGVGAVSGALIADQMTTKFCPTCGKQYTTGTEFCPIDGAELKTIEK